MSPRPDSRGGGSRDAEPLDSLGPEARSLLSIAAMMGSPFPLRLWCAVTGQAMTELLPTVSDALDAGTLTASGMHDLAFGDEDFRQALVERLPPAVRAELHRDIAVRLEREGVPAVVVARHLRQSSWSPGDVDWIHRVAQQLATDDPGSAADLWRKLIGMLDVSDQRRVRFAAGLAHAELLAGQVHRAEQTARLTLRVAVAPQEDGPLLACLSASLFAQRRWREAAGTAEQAAGARGLSADERADQVALAGAAALHAGEVEQALTKVASAERASLTGAGPARTHAMTIRARLAHQRGSLAVAEDYCRRALALDVGDATGHVADIGPQVLLGRVLADADRFDEARAVLDSARRRAERTGAATELQAALIADGCLAVDRGDLDAGVHALDAGLAVLEDGAGPLRPTGTARRAAVALQSLGPRSAEAWLAELPEEIEQTIGAGWVVRARLMHLSWIGRPHDAYRLARAAWTTFAGADLHSELAVVCTELADLAWRHDDERLWTDVATTIARLARQNDAVPTLAHLAATVKALSSDDEDQLVEAARRWRGSPRLLQSGHITEQVAARLHAMGRPEAARAAYVDAADTYARAGAWAAARRIQDGAGNPPCPGGPGDDPIVPEDWGGLTPTERTVAAFLEQGLTNGEIAGELTVSRRTVETHVSHILAKLDLRSRSELVLAAVKRDRSARRR